MSLQMSTPSTPNPLLPAVAVANGAPGSDPVAAEGSPDFAAVLGGLLLQSAQPGQPPVLATTAVPAAPAPRATSAALPAALTDAAADPALAVAVDANALVVPGTPPVPAGEAAGGDATATDASLPAAAPPADATAVPASPLFALFTPASQAARTPQAPAATAAGTAATPGFGGAADVLAAGTPGARRPVPEASVAQSASTPRPADAVRTAAGFAAKAKEAGQNLAARLNAGQSESAASAPTAAPAPPAERAQSALPAQAAALLQAPPAQPAAVAPAAAPVVVDVPAPLGTRLWEQQIGQQVVWVSRQEQHSAEIHINPPDLGPVELRVTLDAQSGSPQAMVHFASPHAEVREALQNALPQLREAMADAGIALGNATVGSESFREQSASAQPGTAGRRGAASGADALPGADAAPASTTRRGNGLVDLFA